MNDLKESGRYRRLLRGTAVAEADWKALCGKTVLVTGATGMVCSFLVDLVMDRNGTLGREEKIRLAVVTRNAAYARERFGAGTGEGWFTAIEGDISECGGRLPLPAADYIIAGAGNADPAGFAGFPADTLKSNYEGAARMLEAARANGGCRMVYLSSGEVYGNAGADAGAFKEEDSYYVDPADPRSCYPCAKRAAESLCVAYASQYGTDVCMARLCYIYGPTFRDSDSRSVAQFLKQAARGGDIVLKGGGEQVRSYCYVPDAVSAVIFLLLHGERAGAYNVCGRGRAMSVREFAEAAAGAAGVGCRVSLPSEGEKKGYSKVARAVQDPAKINRLGWHPRFPVREGIAETVRILEEAGRW